MVRDPSGHFRHAARRVAALLLVGALLAATLLGGRSFSWCPLGEPCSERCAALSADGARDAAPGPTADSARHADYAFGELPDAGQRSTTRHAAAAPLALLPGIPAVAIPRFVVAQSVSAVRPGVRRPPPRAGPHSAAARCAALQVFHC